MRTFIRIVAITGLFWGSLLATTRAQSAVSIPENWHHQDAQQDQLRGISTERAYQELLAQKKAKRKVVVAVIDSGIDVEHEDLRDVIWTNADEIGGNGIDDDKNGYVDDIHGWNFIGGPNGTHIAQDQLEITREYAKYQTYFEGKDTTKLSNSDLKLHAYYQKVKSLYDIELQEAQDTWNQIGPVLQGYLDFVNLLKEELGKETLTMEDVEGYDTSDNPDLSQAKLQYLGLTANGVTEKDVNGYYTYLRTQLDYQLNTEFDPRNIVADDYSNPRERYYGNNSLEGPDATHGTHVAGIIGAVRGNGIGMDGVSAQVEIMVIRAVPDGDERDKDVANAIRYAAENGANIINMSFGKALSPQKEVVDEAVRFAAEKGVLLIHAAGNSSKNLDQEENYPSRNYLSKGTAKNWLEIGATGYEEEGEFVADFSNYGRESVDLFAPGKDIYSTVPRSQYERNSGTSMAAPVVAGAAAVLMSYYPNLSAEQVGEILFKSATSYAGRPVNLPGNAEETVDFKSLCRSGGILNLHAALLLAEKHSN